MLAYGEQADANAPLSVTGFGNGQYVVGYLYDGPVSGLEAAGAWHLRGTNG